MLTFLNENRHWNQKINLKTSNPHLQNVFWTRNMHRSMRNKTTTLFYVCPISLSFKKFWRTWVFLMGTLIPLFLSLQRIVRGFVARKRFLRLKSGFTRLQAAIRGFLVRKKVKRMHDSATKIQRQYRGYKKTKKDQDSFIQLKKATSVIQNEWRRWKYRQGIEWWYTPQRLGF